MALDPIAELDELRLTVVVDNETDTLSSVDDGVPQSPEVVGHLGRPPAPKDFAGHPGKVVFDRLCCGCHGFSVLATARRGDRQHTLLFDVGPYASVWKENADRLGIDLSAIAQARQAAGREPPFVDVHPDRPDQRGVLLPSGVMILLPPEPGFDDLAKAGARVARNAEDHALLDGFFLGSGRIERVTSYETGFPGHH